MPTNTTWQKREKEECSATRRSSAVSTLTPWFPVGELYPAQCPGDGSEPAARDVACDVCVSFSASATGWGLALLCNLRSSKHATSYHKSSS